MHCPPCMRAPLVLAAIAHWDRPEPGIGAHAPGTGLARPHAEGSMRHAAHRAAQAVVYLRSELLNAAASSHRWLRIPHSARVRLLPSPCAAINRSSRQRPQSSTDCARPAHGFIDIPYLATHIQLVCSPPQRCPAGMRGPASAVLDGTAATSLRCCVPR